MPKKRTGAKPKRKPAVVIVPVEHLSVLDQKVKELNDWWNRLFKPKVK